MDRKQSDFRKPFDPAKAARDRAAALEAQAATPEPMTLQQRLARSKPGLRPLPGSKRAAEE